MSLPWTVPGDLSSYTRLSTPEVTRAIASALFPRPGGAGSRLDNQATGQFFVIGGISTTGTNGGFRITLWLFNHQQMGKKWYLMGFFMGYQWYMGELHGSIMRHTHIYIYIMEDFSNNQHQPRIKELYVPWFVKLENVSNNHWNITVS